MRLIRRTLPPPPASEVFQCEARHVDGSFNAKRRAQLIDWLKQEDARPSCRILSNARCLAEGVDVPGLDAVLFMHPRKSQIDVVQSVGRVMRRSKGKNLGYIILPIGIPAGMDPSEALNDNKRYRLVWDTLNALRSHDERLEVDINKARFDDGIKKSGSSVDVSARIKIMSVAETQGMLGFEEYGTALVARMVRRCGQRDYWEDWTKNVAEIARKHTSRIKEIIAIPGKERAAFEDFLQAIRTELNEKVTEEDAAEMLAQHLITQPIFDELFGDYEFVKRNPVSQAMQNLVELLNEHSINKEAETLQKFYNQVKGRIAGVDSPKAKQKIVIEFYDKFFRHAFRKNKKTDRLGIVYTPVEIVDFILHSVNEILQQEFGETLGSEGVHIIDPFVGTGTFITRLLQSRIVRPEELARKYGTELHANEILLLAYYIATANIEMAYRDVSEGDYKPFEGICLADTFQLYEESEDLAGDCMKDNNSRRMRQKSLEDIRVIVGNPPYSVGQDRADSKAVNLRYPRLDKKINETYVAHAQGFRSSLYDNYIRGLRWATDRLGPKGVIGYVTNAGWLTSKSGAGVRHCFAKEFSSIYVFHLRGDARTQRERRRKEKDNVFGQGTRTPVAIVLLVKNPKAFTKRQIYFYDIGDYLTLKDKLDKITKLRSIEGISALKAGWRRIKPDSHGDWVDQRVIFTKPHLSMGGRESQPGLFNTYSSGLKTNRDAWAYNDSKDLLARNMQDMIDFYNSTVDDPNRGDIDDETKISWSAGLRKLREKGVKLKFRDDAIGLALYRPFNLRYLYYDKHLNESRSRIPQIFPDFTSHNRVICISGTSSRDCFSALMTKHLPDVQLMFNNQCFPMYLYAADGLKTSNILIENGKGRMCAITDAGLKFFEIELPSETITKEELFYYAYGLLHSPTYKKYFANNLKIEHPKIILPSKQEDFRKFVNAGRKLGDLHCNFENAKMHPIQDDIASDDPLFHRVSKMKFDSNRGKTDYSTIIYNSNIKITEIPPEAHAYMVNGKPALEWVMERRQVATDKASGIINDPNVFSGEAQEGPAYLLNLLRRIIVVSSETMKIVKSLPSLDLKD